MYDRSFKDNLKKKTFKFRNENRKDDYDHTSSHLAAYLSLNIFKCESKNSEVYIRYLNWSYD